MKQISLLLAILIFSEAYSQDAIKTYAVIVGVAKYNSIKSLRYPKDDAYRFYAHLKSVEGGSIPEQNISLLIDEEASNSNILKKLKIIFSKAGINDRVIFYFSGHGNNGYFLPYDYDGYNNKLLHTEISEIFKQSKAKYKICIADACHSGSFEKDKSVSSDVLDSYYSTLNSSTGGFVLLMSSAADETSIETDGNRQGAFSFF